MSRLVDICRQCIVFHRVSDLLVCFHAIATDCDVVPVRIKNRMDPDVDSAAWAGYRDVCINLRLVNQRTIDLGAETHICEVQLILASIASLKVTWGD